MLQLAKVSGKTHGWRMALPLAEDGSVRLPPLSEGAYTLGIDAPWPMVLDAVPDAAQAPGRLDFVEISRNESEADAFVLGAVRVEGPIWTGTLPSTWVRANSADATTGE